MTSQTFFHHLVEDCPRLHEAFIHSHKIRCKTPRNENKDIRLYTAKLTSLLSVLINQLNDLRPQTHTLFVQFLEVNVDLATTVIYKQLLT